MDEVEEEACEIWCRKKRVSELQTRTACFVSIGTGHPGNKSVNDRVDKFLMETLRDIATETETTARKSENKWAQQMENETYFRFNVDHGLDDVGLEEYAKEDKDFRQLLDAVGHIVTEPLTPPSWDL